MTAQAVQNGQMKTKPTSEVLEPTEQQSSRIARNDAS